MNMPVSDKPDPKNGAELLLDVLVAEGVQYIFGNPGTTEMPLMHSLSRYPQLEYVLGLQETSVVAMADGYAQASGKPAFVNLHTSGGLGHAMGAALHSLIARTPMLITAGQQDSRHAFTRPLLYGNLLKLAEPVAKWCQEVAHPEQIPALVRCALQDACSAPRGPVFLSLPVDVMMRPVSKRAGNGSVINRESIAGGLDALAAALQAIPPGRLAIIAGDEIMQDDAIAVFENVVDVIGAPVYGPSWPNAMSFPPTHPLWRGNLPTSAADMRAALIEYEAIFVVGGDPFVSYLYTEGAAVPAHCALFQLSNDAGEPGRTYAVTLACVGHIRASLTALLPTLTEKMQVHRQQVAVLRRNAELARQQRLAAIREQLSEGRQEGVISPFTAAGEVMAALDENVAVVDESPVTMLHMRTFLETQKIRRYFFMRSAILGWGLPAAVGVSLGLNRAPVVAIIGDGSSLYSPQGLWTAAKQRLPVTFIIMNNAEYGILKKFSAAQGYALSGETAIPGMDITEPAVDFMELALSMGVRSRRILAAGEITAAVREGIASGEPNLIEIVLSGPDVS